MIKNYSKFKEDILFENMISESIVYFSPELRKMLGKINSEVSKELLSAEGENIKKDITFIDIDNREGYVTFKTMRNVEKALDKYPISSSARGIPTSFNKHASDYLYSISCLSWTETRSPVGIGRLVNSILPGKFNSKEIEDFTNKFKMRQTNATEKFEIVEGEDITYWYNETNYYELSYTLGNSCMRDVDDYYFRIYTENPDVCKMLILLDENEDGEIKLKGRALLWKVSKNDKNLDFEWFLDRQYTTNDADVLKFREYAKKEGWAYKTRNTHHDLAQITYKETNYFIGMSVNLGKYKGGYDYGSYPYLDTFRRYDPNSGILYNDDESKEENQYILNQTDGTYEETTGNREWSEYYDDYVDGDVAVYSEWRGTYLDRNRSVQVLTGSYRYHGWYPEGDEDIVVDGWNNDYINSNDAIYSEHYGYHLLESEVVSAINKLDDNGECDEDAYYVHEDDENFISLDSLRNLDWYEKLNEEFSWDYYHSKISKDLLRKDEKGNWILKILDAEVFKTEESVRGMNYFTELDAKALGLEIDKDDSKIIQREDYEKELIKRDLVKILINKFARLLRKGQLKLDLGDDDQNWYQKMTSKSKSQQFSSSIMKRIDRLDSLSNS